MITEGHDPEALRLWRLVWGNGRPWPDEVLTADMVPTLARLWSQEQEADDLDRYVDRD